MLQSSHGSLLQPPASSESVNEKTEGEIKNCAGEAPEGDSYSFHSALCNAGVTGRIAAFLIAVSPAR